MSDYRFRFESGYQGDQDFTVYGDGEPYRVSLRVAADALVPRGWNYDQPTYERDVVASVGLLRRHDGREVAIPAAVVEAFNAWRLADYQRARQLIDEQAERYGVIDWERDPVFKRPIPARAGAYYTVRWNRPGPDCWKHGCVGLGWVVGDPGVLEVWPASKVAATVEGEG